MYNIRSPSEFANGFDYTFTEEDSTLVVVFVKLVLLIVENRLTMKIILVINEIHLQLSIRYRRNLNDQRLFLISNRDINPRQPDNFV